MYWSQIQFDFEEFFLFWEFQFGAQNICLIFGNRPRKWRWETERTHIYIHWTRHWTRRKKDVIQKMFGCNIISWLLVNVWQQHWTEFNCNSFGNECSNDVQFGFTPRFYCCFSIHFHIVGTSKQLAIDIKISFSRFYLVTFRHSKMCAKKVMW